MDTVFIVAPQSRLIGNFRAGGRSRRRQAKGLPPRASLRTEVFKIGSVGNGGVVRNVLRLAHAFAHFEAMRQRLRDYIARRPNRLPERSQRRYRSPSHGGEHPLRRPPGNISPPIRPSTATSQAPRVGCCTNHIRARLQISCRSPQPHSWNRPLPTWDLQLLPTEPPGALWVSARIPHGFPASPASCKDTERAIPSN